MNSTNYNCGKIILIILVLMVRFLGYSQSISIATERPAFNNLPPVKPQDEKNQQTDENVIPQENVKLFINQIEIYGQIAKPQAVFIIPGTDPRVDGLRIDRHFFSHIFRPVEKSTLRNVRNKQEKDKDHILW